MKKILVTVEQECTCCGHRFVITYHEDGSYEYTTEPCECEYSGFSPVDGPSISQWLALL